MSLFAFLLEVFARLARPRYLRVAGAGLLALAVPVVAALHPLHTVPKRTPAALGVRPSRRFKSRSRFTTCGPSA